MEADAFAISRINNGSESYYFYTEDQRGSTVNVLDNSGSKVVSYWYNDFGEVIESKAAGYSSFVNEIQYTGGIYDELTGLLYLNARFYDPSIGRFITQDTYRGERNKPNTWHLYAYCSNSPIIHVNPSGHSPWSKTLLLRDYRAIHEMVANLYALQLGLELSDAREISVKTKYANKIGLYQKGRLDVYDYNNHRYYEVKSKGAANRSSTKRQMNKYDRSTVISPKYSKYNNVLLKKGRTSKSNEFYYGAWFVSYNYYKAGLVRYTVKPSKYTVDALQGMAALSLVAGAFFLPKSLVVLGLII